MFRSEYPLRRRASRRLCGEVCGILLLSHILMIVTVLMVTLLQVALTFLLSGLRGADLDAIAKQFQSGRFFLSTQTGLPYLFYCLFLFIVIRVWKGPGFCRGVFRSNRPMDLPAFTQLACVFFSAQMLFSLFSSFLELVLNFFGLSALQAAETAAGGSDSITMFLYTAFLAPFFEELFFRGAILRSFQPFGKRFAIFFSALLFGIYHCNLIQIPFAFAVGLVLGYVAVEYSLWWSVLLHLLNNFVLAELLSFIPGLQNLLVLGLFGAGTVILILRHRDVRRYWQSLHPMPGHAVCGFWTAPATIILLILCALESLLTITPI